jgi:hypothetical protein
MKQSEKEKYYYSPETGMKLLISKELEERMSKDLFPEQTARAREIISKIDPVKFKELTGQDLFKK